MENRLSIKFYYIWKAFWEAFKNKFEFQENVRTSLQMGAFTYLFFAQMKAVFAQIGSLKGFRSGVYKSIHIYLVFSTDSKDIEPHAETS